ncbi:hypothetical protein R1sor_017921 [Riccia sorocarpa]|uniref:Uncharacterized protein n=1 Tax=Riccia sorocarpa TaxID=122646 RepID=A0ABD3IBI2_9MARC
MQPQQSAHPASKQNPVGLDPRRGKSPADIIPRVLAELHDQDEAAKGTTESTEADTANREGEWTGNAIADTDKAGNEENNGAERALTIYHSQGERTQTSRQVQEEEPTTPKAQAWPYGGW